MKTPTRDFIGYGPTPPDAAWPGGARVAVNFCLNYEEGGELCVLNGDDRSEVRVSDVDVQARLGRRDLNIESSYEYGSRVGYWRILRAFTDRGLTGTVNLVGLAGEQNPQALQALIDAGFDLQPHGWRWIDYDTLPEDEERAHIARSIAQIEALTGEKPLGYYAGLPSPATRRLVVEAKSFLYDSDVYNDDLPYWSPDYPGLLLIPYSLDTNDSRFGRAEGAYQTGDEFVSYIRDTFDCLYAEGAERPAMMTIGLHARLLGRPGRIGALHRIMDHMLAHDDVWICRRGDIARHWASRFPDPRC
ncbi:allantoinase [Roseovarius sp. TE539]|uniref:polysaccharide deacetylase family protein n=1 Tax=Roseovarius sp. TE539 TaxID=2249812 RepID=UPI000DDEA290|nr:polysaccharide deacetylase family protein [Roseovarius sp. TE539]RBI68962.1 allantoinase [Roseovarius sp. TE539]